MTTSPDDSSSAEWKLLENKVYELFDQLPDDTFTAIASRLTDLGFAGIEDEYPLRAHELLFRAQGRSLAQTDCLNRVMLAELPRKLQSATSVLLPVPGDDPAVPRERAGGIILGPLAGSVLVPLHTGDGVVATIVDPEQLRAEAADTFDPTVQWTHLRVSGAPLKNTTDITSQWTRAVSAAQRGLATELLALADQVLRLAVEHLSISKELGAQIGPLQSHRHALGQAYAVIEGARALLREAWQYGGPMGAQASKACAGRAHRAVSDVALQVCGAIGLTADHDLHRYVRRGFQLTALGGTPAQLESHIGRRLFDSYPADLGLPMVIASSH